MHLFIKCTHYDHLTSTQSKQKHICMNGIGGVFQI